MPSLRVVGALVLVTLLHFKLSTCRSPGEGGKGPAGSQDSGNVVDLQGVDTSSLTAREKHDWSSAVSELLAPCPDQPVSIAQCVKESRPCKACNPAARFLAKQVRKGKTRSQMDAAFKKRFAPDQVKEIPLAGSPTRGPDDAPVTIVEFADFECPGCGKAYPLIERLLKRFPGQIRFVFKNYPLSIHKHSEKAARAGLAAAKQGKFWEMHHKLFELQPNPPDDAAIERAARELGLDMKKFAEDLASEAVADEVARDRKQGDALDLESTPLIYIDGRHFDLDMFDFGEDLDEWIELEIEMKTGKKVEPVSVKDDEPAPSAKPEASAAPPPSGGTKAKTDAAPAPKGK
jgi:protein-disulfide isomerase